MQFVISLVWSKWSANDLHWSRLVNDAGIQMHRIPPSLPERDRRRNRRLPEASPPGPRGPYRFHAHGPGRYNSPPAPTPPQSARRRQESFAERRLTPVKTPEHERSFQKVASLLRQASGKDG